MLFHNFLPSLWSNTGISHSAEKEKKLCPFHNLSSFTNPFLDLFLIHSDRCFFKVQYKRYYNFFAQFSPAQYSFFTISINANSEIVQVFLRALLVRTFCVTPWEFFPPRARGCNWGEERRKKKTNPPPPSSHAVKEERTLGRSRKRCKIIPQIFFSVKWRVCSFAFWLRRFMFFKTDKICFE